MPKPTYSYVTVKDLIEALQACDHNAMICMSSDAEGNRYSPLSGVGGGKYNAKERDYSDEDDAEGVPCVCFWPV